MSLNSRELRTISAAEANKIQKKINKFPIYFILENVLDTYNIEDFLFSRGGSGIADAGHQQAVKRHGGRRNIRILGYRASSPR